MAYAHTLLIPTLSAGLSITAFTQTWSAELLTNPDFTTWSGDNPTGWSVVGESPGVQEVTQVAPGGGAGTGAARIYRASASLIYLTQTMLQAGSWYEAICNTTARTSGTLGMGDTNFSIFALTSSNALPFSGIRRAESSQSFVWISTNPGDFVIDSVSYKKVTLHPEVTYAANGTFEFLFTLPASPIAGQRVEMWYRAGGDLNYWTAMMLRNAGNTDWDFALYSASAGILTLRIYAASIGTTNGMRVIASGNDHTAYTTADGGASWTQRGTTVTNSTHSTQTGVRPVYAFGTTPIRLTAV
jgi:hypothetical protein